MNDDELDQELRSWGSERVAAAPRVDVPHFGPGKRSRTPLLAIVATVVAILAVVGAVLVVRANRHSSAQPAATSDGAVNVAYSPHTSDLVLNDGDTITATGTVLAVSGKPLRFCDENAPSTEAYDPFRDCRFGITVSGVELSELSSRRERAGVIIGEAELTGVYRHGHLTVTHQARVPLHPSVEMYQHSPCAASAARRLGPGSSGGLSFKAVQRYTRSHPGAIVMQAQLNVSRYQALVYVLTSGDPQPVRAALEPSYGKHVCVVRSAFSASQIHAAHALLLAQMSAHHGSPTTPVDVGGGGLNPTTEQPMVEANVPVLAQGFADRIDAQPPGLVQVTVWLAPQH